MFCANCGNEKSESAKFCRSCGSQLIRSIQSNPIDYVATKPEVIEISRNTKFAGSTFMLSAFVFAIALVVPAASHQSRGHTLNVFHIGRNYGYTAYVSQLVCLIMVSGVLGIITFQGRRPPTSLRWGRIFASLYGVCTAFFFSNDISNFVNAWNNTPGAITQSIGPAVATWWIGTLLLFLGVVSLSVKEFKRGKTEFFIVERRSLFVKTEHSWFKRFFDGPIYSDWIVWFYIAEAVSYSMNTANDPLWYQTAKPGVSHGSSEVQAYIGGFFLQLILCLIISFVRSLFRKIKDNRKRKGSV